MHRFFSSVVKPLLDAVRPEVIVYVGEADGAYTTPLLELGHEHGCVVHLVDRRPKLDVAQLEERHRDIVVTHDERSLNVLSRIDRPDVVLLDGDHNWFTVIHELRLLERRAARTERPFPVVVIHHLDWPYGRRDRYDDPRAIPDAYRQPFRVAGVEPGRADLVQGGGLNLDRNHAIYENDFQNGVRTAVEDFVAETTLEVELLTAPGMHGVGLVVPVARLQSAPALRAFAEWLGSPGFLREQCDRVELRRIETLIAEQRAARQLTSAESDRTRLRARTEKLEHDAQELRKNLEQTAASEGRVRAELLEQHAALKRAENQLGERAALERAAQEAEFKAERRREQIEKLAFEGKRVEQELAARETELEEARNDLAMASHALEAAERDREVARREAELAAEATREAVEELAERDAAHADALRRAEALRQDICSELAERERELADARRRVEVAEARLRRELAEFAERNAAPDIVDAGNEGTSTEVEELSTERLTLVAELRAREAEIASLWEQLRDVSVRSPTKDGEVESLAAARFTQVQAPAAGMDADALQDALWTRDVEISRLLGELETIRSDIERAAASRSWRYGHAVMRFLSGRTFRSSRREGALERVLRRLHDVAASSDVPPLPPPRLDRIRSIRPVDSSSRQAAAVTPSAAGAASNSRQDPAASRLPSSGSAEHRLTADQLSPGGEERARALGAFRSEATRAAVDAAASNLGRARATLESFHNGLGGDWLTGAREKNMRFFQALGTAGRRRPLKVMIGTLESGEAELDACRRAIARQTYAPVEHITIRGLPKQAAVAALLERFLESEFDVLVKVDADVVLLDDTFVERAVTVLRANDRIHLLQMAILDFFSGGAMQGVNAYRSTMDWQADRQDPLFSDRAQIPKENRLVAWAPFVRSAIHSPNPSSFQAFHFGMHRGMKVLQPGAGKFRREQAVEQTMYLERTWEHFLLRRDSTLALACLGFELALAGEFELSDVDYTSPRLRERFSDYEKLDVGDLEARVKDLRESKVASERVEPLREQRRTVLWRATADIESIVMVLPHFGVFGGVNRFFELARCLGELGVECVLARPDDPLLTNREQLVVARHDYPDVPTSTLSEVLGRAWDVALCGDCTSGVMLTMPFFEARIAAAYLLQGWMYREANARQINLTAPDAVIANSSYVARFYEDFAPAVVPGGVDLAVFRPPPSARRVDRGANGGGPERDAFKVLAYGGRNKASKRFEDVLEACERLHSEGVPVELHVYDQTPLKLDVAFSWRFHGGLLKHQVRDLMWEMDAMLSPTRDAGWSNPTAEAMASGIPVVCTEAGTVDFARHEETALVVPSCRADLLADAARRLWDDPALGESLAAAGVKQIAAYGWPDVARQLLDLFRDVRRDGSRRKALNNSASTALEELTSRVHV